MHWYNWSAKAVPALAKTLVTKIVPSVAIAHSNISSASAIVFRRYGQRAPERGTVMELRDSASAAQHFIRKLFGVTTRGWNLLTYRLGIRTHPQCPRRGSVRIRASFFEIALQEREKGAAARLVLPPHGASGCRVYGQNGRNRITDRGGNLGRHSTSGKCGRARSESSTGVARCDRDAARHLYETVCAG